MFWIRYSMPRNTDPVVCTPDQSNSNSHAPPAPPPTSTQPDFSQYLWSRQTIFCDLVQHLQWVNYLFMICVQLLFIFTVTVYCFSFYFLTFIFFFFCSLLLSLNYVIISLIHFPPTSSFPKLKWSFFPQRALFTGVGSHAFSVRGAQNNKNVSSAPVSAKIRRASTGCPLKSTSVH